MTLYIAVAALIVAVVCLVLLIVLLIRQKGLDPARLTDAVADEVTQRSAVALKALSTTCTFVPSSLIPSAMAICPRTMLKEKRSPRRRQVAISFSLSIRSGWVIKS